MRGVKLALERLSGCGCGYAVTQSLKSEFLQKYEWCLKWKKA